MKEEILNKKKQELEKLDEKIAEMQAKKKAIQRSISEEERKKRTKRLIEIGAVVESVIGAKIEREDLAELRYCLEELNLKMLMSVSVGNYFSSEDKKEQEKEI